MEQAPIEKSQVMPALYPDQGVTGQGESTDSAVGGAAIINGVVDRKSAATMGQTSAYFGGMRNSLIGQDPLNVDNLWERLRTAGIFGGAQGGQYVTAMSAVESALWDLTGKALGLPVYQLLGGKMRDRIRMYCDGVSNRRGDQAKVECKQVLDMGFTAVKTDINMISGGPAQGPRQTAETLDFEQMVDAVAFVREVFPKSVSIGVDLHGRTDMTTGKRLARKLEPFDLMWLEEPVPPDNIDAMRDIRESTSTPICCGENLFLRYGFRELFEKRATDIAMPDFQKCGGLLEGRRIADMAHTYFVPIAPHCVVSPIGTMGSAHVCAAIPNFLCLEFHWRPRLEQWRTICKEGDVIEKGFITIPELPGIGVEMDDEVAKKYSIPGTPFFEAV
jgi:galactonate dehydratase